MIKQTVTTISLWLFGPLSLALLSLALSACHQQRAFSIESTDGIPYYVVPVRSAPTDSGEAALLQTSVDRSYEEKSIDATVPAATQPALSTIDSELSLATCFSEGSFATTPIPHTARAATQLSDSNTPSSDASQEPSVLAKPAAEVCQ